MQEDMTELVEGMPMAAVVGGVRVAVVVEGLRVVMAVIEEESVVVSVEEMVELMEDVEGEVVMSGGRSVFCLSLEAWLGEGAGSLTGI